MASKRRHQFAKHFIQNSITFRHPASFKGYRCFPAEYDAGRAKNTRPKEEEETS